MVRLLGNRTSIRIFGSRARLDEKGGDIDILVETDHHLINRMATTCRLTSELQMQLGDQKMDIILTEPGMREQLIHKIARQTGVIV